MKIFLSNVYDQERLNKLLFFCQKISLLAVTSYEKLLLTCQEE